MVLAKRRDPALTFSFDPILIRKDNALLANGSWPKEELEIDPMDVNHDFVDALRAEAQQCEPVPIEPSPIGVNFLADGR